MPTEFDRQAYGEIYGPTTGDRVRLGDSNLWIEIEDDVTGYGDEALIGLGKTVRDGMLASARIPGDSELDLVITNVVVVDAVLGIVKTNLGVKDGHIVAIGRTGNPDIVDDVDVLIGTTTTVITGEGLIATPGAIDSHVHLMSPRVVAAALSAGVTTIVGMGSGPVWDIGVNPGFTLRHMEAAFASFPVNTVFLARGSSSRPEPMERALASGAGGFKVHEDTGAAPAAIDAALGVAEAHDVAVAVHFDGLGESGELEDFLEATRGRTVHAYHVEGAGGGPVNLLEVVGVEHVIPSSTTPTIPYTVNALDEHEDMILSAHALHPGLPGDVEAARIRVRGSTMAAEERLHDLGAISITNSDALGMGRVDDTLRRTFQMANRMKGLVGESGGAADNERVLAYLAKLTINPALTHGLAHLVGSLEVGKLADVVLWKPAFFPVKPEMVVKGGFVAWGAAGSGSASVERAEPVTMVPMFGGSGTAPRNLSIRFVASAALEDRERTWHGRPEPVRQTRGVRKRDMVRNDRLPTVQVDPATHVVAVDGEPITSEPARTVPLNRLYLLG
ncbi:MAG TPA: urease subunit alpha [Actinomycetota bacterium]|nr:urease subunit alpha [Actinomycetota bacterium]